MLYVLFLSSCFESVVAGMEFALHCVFPSSDTHAGFSEPFDTPFFNQADLVGCAWESVGGSDPRSEVTHSLANNFGQVGTWRRAPGETRYGRSVVTSVPVAGWLVLRTGHTRFCRFRAALEMGVCCQTPLRIIRWTFVQPMHTVPIRNILAFPELLKH
jgi:hypothetical protein